MQYTSEQQKIIQHDISSHAIVSAVAGSGKTQTLIARIEYLLAKGIPANKILVLMYNKSAQLDFANRLKKVLSAEKSKYINVRTMHSLGNSFLQAFAKAGYIEFNKILKDYEVDSILLNLIKNYQKNLKSLKR
nr:UvrD-helicase domain-containing protein [Allofrancisella inopinata]